MQQYLLDTQSALASVSSNENGLTNAEAQKRLCDNGPNKLAEGKKTPLIVRFLEQMKDPMILILLAAALVSGIIGVAGALATADLELAKGDPLMWRMVDYGAPADEKQVWDFWKGNARVQR